MSILISLCSARPIMFITESTCCPLLFAVTVLLYSVKITAMLLFPLSPPVGESRMKLLWKILTSCPTLSCVPAGERTEVCKAFREGILPLRLRQIILEHLIPFRVMRAVPCIPVIAGPGLVILT